MNNKLDEIMPDQHFSKPVFPWQRTLSYSNNQTYKLGVFKNKSALDKNNLC